MSNQKESNRQRNFCPVSKETLTEMFRDELEQQADIEKRKRVERYWMIYFIVATVMCVVIAVAIEYWPLFR